MCFINKWTAVLHISSLSRRKIFFAGPFCPHLAELLQLPAQPEGGEEGVLTGERNEGGAWQRFVDVEAWAWVTQAVHVWARHALHTVTAHLRHDGTASDKDTFTSDCSFHHKHLMVSHLVGLRHGHALLHQELDNFIVVGVCSQYNGGDVRCKVRELFVQ